MFRNFIQVAIATIALLAPAAAVEPVIIRNDTPWSNETVLRAVAMFSVACKPLGGAMWDELESIEVEALPEFAEFRKDRGWKYTIFVRAKVPDSPSLIPASRADIGVIAGHTLHYDIGGGKSPGFFSTKRASNYLCGIKNYDTGDSLFVSVPGLKFLK